MRKPGAERMYQMLARNHALAGEIAGSDFPLEELDVLQRFQLDRIAKSFADLIEQDSSRPAVDFFLSELYGGFDFRERDQDMSKVMPVMIRFLPDRTLMTMSEAFELQAISLEFDIDMARHMQRTSIRSLDMRQYCEVYRASGDQPARERQIQLIRKLGFDLEKLVKKPLVNALARLMRGPAHAAGFGKLQNFLEAGLGSFRALKDVHEFVDTIYQREWVAMHKMFEGEEKPFGF
jgi:hypothetical protein